MSFRFTPDEVEKLESLHIPIENIEVGDKVYIYTLQKNRIRKIRPARDDVSNLMTLDSIDEYGRWHFIDESYYHGGRIIDNDNKQCFLFSTELIENFLWKPNFRGLILLVNGRNIFHHSDFVCLHIVPNDKLGVGACLESSSLIKDLGIVKNEKAAIEAANKFIRGGFRKELR